MQGRCVCDRETGQPRCNCTEGYMGDNCDCTTDRSNCTDDDDDEVTYYSS